MQKIVLVCLFSITAAIEVELSGTKDFKDLKSKELKKIIINKIFFPSDYVCEEPHGYFPDSEQCDLYYECKDGVATPKLCPDGLLFLRGEAISVKCDYPFNIDCGSREFVRECASIESCWYLVILQNPFLQRNLNQILTQNVIEQMDTSITKMIVFVIGK